jgi:hypothetical protein
MRKNYPRSISIKGSDGRSVSMERISLLHLARASELLNGLAKDRVHELEFAQNIPFSLDKVSGHHLNDDKSPLIDLLSCLVCRQTMKLEKSAPDAQGRDIIQYRCEVCKRIELLRLFRRSRDAISLKAKGK